MAYVKQNWETGELITSQKLNHMEDGIAEGGGGAFMINANDDGTSVTLDKTWQEIWDAYDAGSLCLVYHHNEYEGAEETSMNIVGSIKEEISNGEYLYSVSIQRFGTLETNTNTGYPYMPW